jgi:pimeloyl-ACP methyl ester carboxylesterase
MSTVKTIRTNVLEIAFLEEGPATGWPVVLAHGFPYDVHAYDEVAPQLAKAGGRPCDHALSARLRSDALSRRSYDAQRAAGRAWP